MKKLLYCIFLSVALCVGFTACDDDDDPVAPTVDKYAVVSDVHFNGEWMKILNADTVRGIGSMDMVMTDSVGGTCVDVFVEGTELGLTRTKFVANIVQEGFHGFRFSNTTPSKFGFDSPIAGFVSLNSSMSDLENGTVTFTKKVKSGRKTYEYKFIFNGVKTEITE